VVANQGGFLRGDPGAAVGVIADTIVKMIQHQQIQKKKEREVVADERWASCRNFEGRPTSAEHLLREELLRLREEMSAWRLNCHHETERVKLELGHLHGVLSHLHGILNCDALR
jgi:hypothetical protein